jgi:hypothetical protein
MNVPTHWSQENSITYLDFVLRLLRLVTNPLTIRLSASLPCPARFVPTVAFLGRNASTPTTRLLNARTLPMPAAYQSLKRALTPKVTVLWGAPE